MCATGSTLTANDECRLEADRSYVITYIHIDGNLATWDLSAAADLAGEEGSNTVAEAQRRRLGGVDIIAHMLGQ